MAIGFFNPVCSFCPFRYEGKDDLCDLIAFAYYSILMTVSFHRTTVTGANHFSEPFKMTKLYLKNCPSLIEFSTCQLISMSNIFFAEVVFSCFFYTWQHCIMYKFRGLPHLHGSAHLQVSQKYSWTYGRIHKISPKSSGTECAAENMGDDRAGSCATVRSLFASWAASCVDLHKWPRWDADENNRAS